MKKLAVLMLITFALISCKAPDPYDEVRTHRRKFKLELDISVSEEGEAAYEIKVQNNSGGKNLSDLTVLVRLMDAEKKELWTTQKILDVSGLGNYATESFPFKEQIPPEAAKYEFFDVVLARDDQDSDFMSLREFKRVSK